MIKAKCSQGSTARTEGVRFWIREVIHSTFRYHFSNWLWTYVHLLYYSLYHIHTYLNYLTCRQHFKFLWRRWIKRLKPFLTLKIHLIWCLISLIFLLGKITAAISKDVVKIKWVNAYKVLGLKAWGKKEKDLGLVKERRVKVKVAQSCPTPCDPMDHTVHGILQARILEWVAFPFSRGPSQPRDWTWLVMNI